jgi:hypothetical protein
MLINGGPTNGAPVNGVFGKPFVDWAKAINFLTTRTYYALDIDDRDLPPIRIPMSSWQATRQMGRASFAQAVIPAAGQWESAIYDRAAAGEFIIMKGALFEDGSVEESELARTPIQTVRRNEGAVNLTLTLSGYVEVAAAETNIRELQNIRSITNDPGTRVRCDIDWFLKPGQVAVARDVSFTVSYINYYANVSDQYMDVGERVQ